VTYFFNNPKNVLNLLPSSLNSLSAGTAAATPAGGVLVVGVAGRELGFEVAGVAKGVFEVELMLGDY
jgi:hypothetical protein